MIDAGGIDWPTRCIDGAWVDFNDPSGGSGNFDDPFNTLSAGLANTPADARMQIKSGGTNWTGTISQRVKLHAPLGSAVIGTATP